MNRTLEHGQNNNAVLLNNLKCRLNMHSWYARSSSSPHFQIKKAAIAGGSGVQAGAV
jgi:hypothetical protein